MKNLGYATGQFGKNHVGDRNETLPNILRVSAPSIIIR
jgi:arylsulfatase